jgi:hypothetical protein
MVHLLMKATRLAAPALAVLLCACFGPAPFQTGGPLEPIGTPLFAPSPGITFDEALAAAREAAPQTADYQVAVHEYLPAAELHESLMAMDVPPDRWVWYLFFTEPGGSSLVAVIVDYLDGTVLEVSEGIE